MQLLIQSGIEAGKVVELNQPVVVIGRQTGCDIVLADNQVSRRHLQISMQGGTITLTDLGSANGSFVNGQPLPPNVPVPLRPGDNFKIGDSVMILRPTANPPPVDISATVGGYGSQPYNVPQSYAAPQPNYQHAPNYSQPMSATPQSAPRTKKGGGAGVVIGLIFALIIIGGGIAAIILLGGNNTTTTNTNSSANTPVSGQPNVPALPTTAPGRTGSSSLPPAPPRRSQVNTEVSEYGAVGGNQGWEQIYAGYWISFGD
jgi:pSer/pThr/pTyr-binding forkhead associated (FHA) protein